MVVNKLKDYNIWLKNNGNTVVLISGLREYLEILIGAFPHYRFSPIWADQSGTTLHELAAVLQRAGARVLGLVATKTIRD